MGNNIIDFLKRLYGFDTHHMLSKSFKELSNLKLINKLNDTNLQIEAHIIARKLLVKRLKLKDDFLVSDAINIEMKRIHELSEKCHLCQSPNVSKSFDFMLCKPTDSNLDFSKTLTSAFVSCFTLPILGIGMFSTPEKNCNFQVIELSFNFCELCNKKNKFTKDLCYKHPIIAFYEMHGFEKVFLPSELSLK